MEKQNIEAQNDEVEALASILGTDWCTADEENHIYYIVISDDMENPNYTITLEVTMPPEYPSDGPPIYSLIAPWLGRDKRKLANDLENIYLENMGESIIFLWVEKIREFTIEKASKYDCAASSGLEADSDLLNDSGLEDELSYLNFQSWDKSKKQDVEQSDQCPTIHSGESITDRKSAFQGHLAAVQHPDQVKLVMQKLLENKKIVAATHRIQAYRIMRDEEKKLYYSGHEDDGEFGAGGRMLHLLDIVDATNVVVVVTRWYGGIHLGPDRFKHINNITRQMLMAHGYIKEKNEKKGPKSRKKH